MPQHPAGHHTTQPTAVGHPPTPLPCWPPRSSPAPSPCHVPHTPTPLSPAPCGDPYRCRAPLPLCPLQHRANHPQRPSLPQRHATPSTTLPAGAHPHPPNYCRDPPHSPPRTPSPSPGRLLCPHTTPPPGPRVTHDPPALPQPLARCCPAPPLHGPPGWGGGLGRRGRWVGFGETLSLCFLTYTLVGVFSPSAALGLPP